MLNEYFQVVVTYTIGDFLPRDEL